jgi:hypothetical protein
MRLDRARELLEATALPIEHVAHRPASPAPPPCAPDSRTTSTPHPPPTAEPSAAEHRQCRDPPHLGRKPSTAQIDLTNKDAASATSHAPPGAAASYRIQRPVVSPASARRRA